MQNSSFHVSSSLKETGLYDGTTYNGIVVFMLLVYSHVNELVTLLPLIPLSIYYTFMPFIIFNPFTCKRHSCALFAYVPHESTKNVLHFLL